MKDEESVYWCVMAVQRFDNLTVDGLPVQMYPEGPFGYLPVFNDRALAEAFAEGRWPVSAIRAVEASAVKGTK